MSDLNIQSYIINKDVIYIEMPVSGWYKTYLMLITNNAVLIYHQTHFYPESGSHILLLYDTFKNPIQVLYGIGL